jgi:hypothetical protein
MEVIELGQGVAARESIIKLMIERERHHALLVELEKHDFPEIAMRCQTELQAWLQENLSVLSESASEYMRRIFHEELRLTIMRILEKEKINWSRDSRDN